MRRRLTAPTATQPSRQRTATADTPIPSAHGAATLLLLLLHPSSLLIFPSQPFHNPAESYTYYSLPYCMPKSSKLARGSDDDNLGEVLAGDRRRASMYDIRFGVDIQWTALCHFRLSQDDIKQFMDGIKQHYIFEMFVDDLAVKGFVGEIEQTQTKFDAHVHNDTHIYLFTHLDFSLAYNGNNVIAVNLTTDPQQRVELEFGKDVSRHSAGPASQPASQRLFPASSLFLHA